MLHFIPMLKNNTLFPYLGALVGFLLTILILSKLAKFLPKDNGKILAVEGIESKGKPTGAGIFFIHIFIFCAILFIPWQWELLIYYVLVAAAGIFGFLDDKAKIPWNEYKKGFLDLCVSFGVAFTYAIFSNKNVYFPLFRYTYTLSFTLYVLLGTLLVWISINATNCTDGVDGLSASLGTISLFSMIVFANIIGRTQGAIQLIPIMIAVLLAYLWFNANPSSLLMGDAGSRALGVFLAIAVMNIGQPLAYLIFCMIFIVDGLSGIIKISLKRFLNISFLPKTTTPIHDHLKKNLKWSNPQVTIRLPLIQGLISCIYLFLVFLFH